MTYKRGNLDTEVHTHTGNMPHEDGSYNYQKLGEKPSWHLQREHGPAGTSSLDFWPLRLRDTNFLPFCAIQL